MLQRCLCRAPHPYQCPKFGGGRTLRAGRCRRSSSVGAAARRVPVSRFYCGGCEELMRRSGAIYTSAENLQAVQQYCEALVVIFIALAFALCLYICARMLRSTAAVAQNLHKRALRLGNDDAVKLSSDCIDATVDLRRRVYLSSLTVFITFVLRGCYTSMAAISSSGSCVPDSSSTAFILGLIPYASPQVLDFVLAVWRVSRCRYSYGLRVLLPVGDTEFHNLDFGANHSVCRYVGHGHAAPAAAARASAVANGCVACCCCPLVHTLPLQ